MENWLNFREVLYYPWTAQEMRIVNQLIQVEKYIIKIQMLIGVSYDIAKNMYRRLNDHAYEVAQQTIYPNSEFVESRINYALKMMAFGKWDENLWREEVSSYLTR